MSKHEFVIHDNRHQWFVDRLGKTIFPTAYELQYRLNANGYINGIVVQNFFNAEGLWTTEHKEHENMRYFDTWQERNAYEIQERGISEEELVREINQLNDNMRKGILLERKEKEEKVHRNDPCKCGSGKKYKKCCLHRPSLFQMN